MPNNKMERFTQRARRVLSIAQEEAERLQHNYIGTEHMLLGIMLEQHGIGARVLRDLGLEYQRVENLVEELTRSSVRKGTAELSPGTKHVLELAVDEARRMGHHYIGTEHLLLGLVRQSEGIAIDVIKRLGISPDEVRRQTRRALLKPTQPDPPSQMEAEPSSPIHEPKQPMTRLPSDAYELLENVLMKILNMIAEDKLSVAQGVELFSTLTPDLKLAPGQQAELVSHLFEQKRFNNYKVHLTAVDSKGVETLRETELPLISLLAHIDRLLSAALNDPDMPLVFWLGDTSLEVRIERDENQT